MACPCSNEDQKRDASGLSNSHPFKEFWYHYNCANNKISSHFRYVILSVPLKNNFKGTLLKLNKLQVFKHLNCMFLQMLELRWRSGFCICSATNSWPCCLRLLFEVKPCLLQTFSFHVTYSPYSLPLVRSCGRPQWLAILFPIFMRCGWSERDLYRNPFAGSADHDDVLLGPLPSEYMQYFTYQRCCAYSFENLDRMRRHLDRGTWGAWFDCSSPRRLLAQLRFLKVHLLAGQSLWRLSFQVEILCAWNEVESLEWRWAISVKSSTVFGHVVRLSLLFLNQSCAKSKYYS